MVEHCHNVILFCPVLTPLLHFIISLCFFHSFFHEDFFTACASFVLTTALFILCLAVLNTIKIAKSTLPTYSNLLGTVTSFKMCMSYTALSFFYSGRSLQSHLRITGVFIDLLIILCLQFFSCLSSCYFVILA